MKKNIRVVVFCCGALEVHLRTDHEKKSTAVTRGDTIEEAFKRTLMELL